jgi:hypothetical protein
MADKPASNPADIQLIFVVTVVLASFLGGIVSAGLICFRRRQTGMLALAATCAGTALIVATTVVTGGGTIEHAGALGAKYAFVPLVGAALVCLIVSIARIVRAIVRAVVKSVYAFSSDVLSDIRRVAAKRTDWSQDSLREVSKSSRRGLAFIAVLAVVLFGLNARAISDLATRLAPKLSTVTNVLDLISFILVTPKLFTIEIKNNLLDAYIHTLQGYTLGKVQLPRNIVTYSIGAMLLLFSFSLLPLTLSYLLDVFYHQLLDEIIIFSQLAKSTKLFDASFFDYMARHLVESQSVFTAMWPFLGSVMIAYTVITISVIFLSTLAKATPEAQERLADMLLCWGLIVFVYSRALSMMG